MAKETPLQAVKRLYGNKEKLIDNVVDVARGASEEAAEVKDRLVTVSNRKLLRLASVGKSIKDKYGTKDKLVERPLEGPFAAKLGAYDTREAAKKVALRLAAWNVRSFVLQRAGKFELWYGGKKTEDDIQKTWTRLSRKRGLRLILLSSARMSSYWRSR